MFHPTPEDYLASAKKARAEAEETNLPQVRERLLRSARAWEDQASMELKFISLPSRANPGK